MGAVIQIYTLLAKILILDYTTLTINPASALEYIHSRFKSEFNCNRLFFHYFVSYKFARLHHLLLVHRDAGSLSVYNDSQWYYTSSYQWQPRILSVTGLYRIHILKENCYRFLGLNGLVPYQQICNTYQT